VPVTQGVNNPVRNIVHIEPAVTALMLNANCEQITVTSKFAMRRFWLQVDEEDEHMKELEVPGPFQDLLLDTIYRKYSI